VDADRFSDLVEKYVESDLKEQERIEIEGLLKSSAEARRRFWAYLHQHALLRKLMAEAKGRTLAASAPRRGILIAAAAAVFVLAVVGGILLSLGPEPAPSTPPVGAKPAGPKETPGPVAAEARTLPAEPGKPSDSPVRSAPNPGPVPSKEPSPTETAPAKPPPDPKPPAEERLPVPAPPPKTAPEPPKPTIVVAAQVEQVLGQARALGGESVRLKAGQDVLSGQGFEVGPRDSLVVLRCGDGTRLEFGPATRVREIRDEGGKKVMLERGLVSADVPKQPAGKAMVVATPHAEARVQGTRFVLWALPESTRLEVREGRVRVTRREDHAAAEVGADQRAVVAKGVPLAAKPARVSDDLVALYRFDEGPFDLIRDVSGFGVPLDLELKAEGATAWKPTGLSLLRWGRIGSHGAAGKILQACRKSREITLEAWVVPDKASFRYTGYLILLGDPTSPNAALLQGVSSPSAGPYQAHLRTGAVDSGRHAPLSTPKNLVVEGRPAHVAYTRAAGGQERLYVNGVPRAAAVRGGDFSTWKDDAPVSLGLEWLGEYRLVAVYARAMKEAEVVRNFRLGVD